MPINANEVQWDQPTAAAPTPAPAPRINPAEVKWDDAPPASPAPAPQLPGITGPMHANPADVEGIKQGVSRVRSAEKTEYVGGMSGADLANAGKTIGYSAARPLVAGGQVLHDLLNTATPSTDTTFATARDALAHRESQAVQNIKNPVAQAIAPNVIPIGAPIVAGLVGGPPAAAVIAGGTSGLGTYDATERELRGRGDPNAKRTAALAGLGSATGAAAVSMLPGAKTLPGQLVHGAATGAGFDLSTQVAEHFATGKPIDPKQLAAAAGTGVLFTAATHALHSIFKGNPPPQRVQELQQAKTPDDMQQVLARARADILEQEVKWDAAEPQLTQAAREQQAKINPPEPTPQDVLQNFQKTAPQFQQELPERVDMAKENTEAARRVAQQPRTDVSDIDTRTPQKGPTDAVQEQSAAGVLQRQPGQDAESGSGRGRVQPLEQGAQAPSPREGVAGEEEGQGQGPQQEAPVRPAASERALSEQDVQWDDRQAPPPTVSARAAEPTSAEENAPNAALPDPLSETRGQTPANDTAPTAETADKVPPSRQPVKRAPNPFTKTDIENRLVQFHDEQTGGQEAAEQAGSTLEQWNASEEPKLGDFYKPFTFYGKTYPGEVKRLLENNPDLKNTFRLTDDPSKAGGADALHQFGEDRYEELAAKQTGLKRNLIDRAKQTARESNDPQAQFLAALHDNLPASRSRSKQTVESPAAWPEGTKFKIHGAEFEVQEHEDGYRVLKDGDDYPVVPADAIDKLPVDKGSLKIPASENSDADLPDVPSDDFAPPAPAEEDQPLISREEKNALNAPLEDETPPAPSRDTGIFGQEVLRPATGKQQGGLFHEPVQVEGPAREVLGSKEANKPENTAEMFKPAPAPAAPEATIAEPAKPVKNDPRAAQLRRMADNLTKQIEDKRRDLTQNATPKRMRDYRQRRTEGDRLERVQKALHALADAREAGTLPAILDAVRSKSQITPLVAKKMAHNGGYYDAHYETTDYQDSSPAGKALQDLIENKSPEQRQAEGDRQRRQKIEDAENKLRFQKIEGFFPTPRPVIEKMMQAADVQPGQKVLEPSAGKGDIADELRSRGADVSTVEIRPALSDILKAKEHNVVGDDFLKHTGQYDRIVMNPPFERGQDIEHVQHAYEQLKPGGKIVALMSEGSFSRSDRKASEFRQWLNERDGTSEKLAGAFAGKDAFRQTGTASRMVTIEKPGGNTRNPARPSGHVALPDVPGTLGEVRRLRERFGAIEQKDSPELAAAMVRRVTTNDQAGSLVRSFKYKAFGKGPDADQAFKDWLELGYHYRRELLNARGQAASALPNLSAAEVARRTSDPKIAKATALFNKEIRPLIEDIRTSHGMAMDPNAKKVPFFLNLATEADPSTGAQTAIGFGKSFNKAASGEGLYTGDPEEALTRIVGGHLKTEAQAQVADAVRKISIDPLKVKDPLGKRVPAAFERAHPGEPFVADYKGRETPVGVVDLNEGKMGPQGSPLPPEYHYVPLRVAKEMNNLHQHRGEYDTLFDKTLRLATRASLIGDFAPHTARVLSSVGARLAQSGWSAASALPSWLGSTPAAIARMRQMARSPIGEAMQVLVDRSGSNRGAGYGVKEAMTPLGRVLNMPHDALMDREVGIDPLARRVVADAHLRMQLGNDRMNIIEKLASSGRITPVDAARQIEKAIGDKGLLALGRRVNATLGFSNRQTRSELLNWAQRVFPFASSESGMIPDEVRRMLTANLNPAAIGRNLNRGQYVRALVQTAGMLATGTVGVHLLKQGLNLGLTKMTRGQARSLDENDEGHKSDVEVAPGWYWTNLDPGLSRAERIAGAKAIQNKQSPDVGREAVNEAFSTINSGLRLIFSVATKHNLYLADDGRLLPSRGILGNSPVGVGRETASAVAQGKPIGPAIVRDVASAGAGVQLRKSSGENFTDAERVAHDISLRDVMARQLTPEERQRHEDRRLVVEQLRQTPGDRTPLQKAVRAGKITPADAPEILRESSRSNLENWVQRMGAEDAMQVYEKATPAEKSKLKPLVYNHIVRARTLNVQQKRELVKKLAA